jgi:hypothetical protein
MATRQISDIGLPFALKGEAMIASARLRGVLAPVVTPLKLVRYPRSFAPSLVALPSMSLIPVAPFNLLKS